MELPIYLVPLFFLTALVYSTAGLAGGSTYLALLSLTSLSYLTTPRIALLCNFVVALNGFVIFFRAGYFKGRQVIPFVLSSIPVAYLGGKLEIGKTAFLWCLSISLLIAGCRLLITARSFKPRISPSVAQTLAIGLPAGALLGFWSGLVGIGGGIFLAPLLYLLGWGNAREISAAASFFILVNSCSGILGQWSKASTPFDIAATLPLLIAVFLGGQIGSRMGSGLISKHSLQRVTAALVLFVSGRILWSLIF